MRRQRTFSFIILTMSLFTAFVEFSGASDYVPRGMGGGGAMSGLSLSPYAKLWFVGTDMGTLFRSTNEGKSWRAISHKQVVFDSNLERSSSVGFSSNPKLVFYAQGGKKPKRSQDSGLTWEAIQLPLEKEELVRYWLGDTADSQLMFCATTQGLWRSSDSGLHWKKVQGVIGDSKGTFISNTQSGKLIFHATASSILISKNRGRDFEVWFTPAKVGIRSFAGGANEDAATLSWIDTDGARACEWARYAKDSSQQQIAATIAECGYVWVSKQLTPDVAPNFIRTQKDAGRYVRMAENDPATIYITGGNWVRQYGSKVWVSHDFGAKWEMRFHILNWDTRPYAPWPKEKLEYSAVGLDVGWHDNAFPSFVVDQRNSARAGGTGYYFVHVTDDFGKNWKAPFTEFADEGERLKGKKWKSTGLEVTSVQKLKFHPKDTKIGYAGLADMGGLVTEDGGETWRISQCKYNTNYDYAFDPSDSKLVYAASGSLHDFPIGNHNLMDGTEGGVFRSMDRGRTWVRLTPTDREWNIEFLSVAYDPIHKTLYGGTRGKGIGYSTDGGRKWKFFNEGLPASGNMIPQMEVDPENGNVYALLTGDAPAFTNQKKTGIYILEHSRGGKRWRLLRGSIATPRGISPSVQPWWFPTAFAVDFSRPKRDVLWLADMESKGAWLSSGIWKSIDSGDSWQRLKQFTHPTAITLNPKNPDRVYASGLHNIDGVWGEGGAIFSIDGGSSWQKNENIPLLSNLDGTVLDPNRQGKIFYLFFGGGMLYGNEPN